MDNVQPFVTVLTSFDLSNVNVCFIAAQVLICFNEDGYQDNALVIDCFDMHSLSPSFTVVCLE